MRAERLDHPYVAEPGVVYTRSWVVELMLDLAGYESGENLVDAVAVEPSCGNGEFLEAMILRLSSSCRRQGRELRDCRSSLIAFDLDPESVTASRKRAESVLVGCGWEPLEAHEVAQEWIRTADFLLDPHLDLVGLGGGVDFVIGNPPYVRLEDIDEGVVEAYRKRYGTMSGRADLYIGFFERALGMLAPDGVCAFICADRWMLNQYGSRLRSFITRGDFSVESVIEMHEAQAFHDEVLAYPAITTIRRSDRQGRVFVAKVGQDSSRAATELSEAARRIRLGEPPASKVEVDNETDPAYTIEIGRAHV